MRTVIFDIDGVLCDCAQALHDFIATDPTEDDWHGTWFPAMGGHPPHAGWLALNGLLAPEVNVVLLTNRPEWTRGLTEAWLAEHGVRYDELVMRPAGTRYSEGKRARIEKIARTSAVVLAVDDDATQVELYRAAGIPTIHAWDELDKVHDEGRSR